MSGDNPLPSNFGAVMVCDMRDPEFFLGFTFFPAPVLYFPPRAGSTLHVLVSPAPGAMTMALQTGMALRDVETLFKAGIAGGPLPEDRWAVDQHVLELAQHLCRVAAPGQLLATRDLVEVSQLPVSGWTREGETRLAGDDKVHPFMAFDID
jgi:hypothetical protein